MFVLRRLLTGLVGCCVLSAATADKAFDLSAMTRGDTYIHLTPQLS